MKKHRPLRPSDLAKAIGMSIQTVHEYEKWSFLPQVERGPQGYRLYTPQHLHALRVARLLIQGYGWQYAQRIMQFVHHDQCDLAWAEMDARHTEIHQSRRELQKTLEVLREPATAALSLIDKEYLPKPSRGFLVGEAAQRAGVRVSAVRFWEAQGLLHPLRDQGSGYRLYDQEQLRTLKIVALLRKAGADFEAIRLILTQVAQGTPDQAISSAEKRLKELAETSRRCVEATAALWRYVEERTHL